MNTDRKAILAHLATVKPRRPQSASAIAAACAIGRTDAAKNLAGLQTAGLVELAVRGSGWKLTKRGVDHVETRMAL